MQVERINSKEYSELFDKVEIPFNSVLFNLLNAYKCDRLEFLLFNGDSLKIGLIAGIKEKCLLSPFSAPFSCFSFQKEQIKTKYFFETIEALGEYSIKNQINIIRITLPPAFYNESNISKMIFSFFRCNYSIIIDESHFFYTKDFKHYENGTIKRDVIRNLRVAENSGLIFKKADNIEDYKVAYEINKNNRESKDRSINMTFEQLLEIRSICNIDYFMVLFKYQPIASAIVYVYSPRIVQIIFWGCLPGFNYCYPMNFLAMNIFRFYRGNKIEIIDVGNSSHFGEPNYGLSNFKGTIGSTSTTKLTFIKTL